VRQYPCYTHDDIFYLEYDFAMLLLIGMARDIDNARAYDRARQSMNNNKPKTAKR
jgi:hypothetical protein